MTTLRPLVIVTLALTASPAWAETYYVDYEGGSDGNSGTTEGAPWQHVPGDSAAAGTAAAASLAPGDVVYFRTGTTYVTTSGFALAWSGSAADPITYDGQTWGGGERAVVTTDNAEVAAIHFGSNPESHIVVQGFFFRDVGGYAEDDPVWDEPPGGWVESQHAVTAPPGGTGINLTRAGASHITVADCSFEEIGQWQNRKPLKGINSVTGTGVSIQNVSDIVIERCEFTRMKTGVSIKATELTERITVRDSSFHDSMNWLIDIAPRANGATLRDIDINHNHLYDYKQWDTPNWEGWGEKPHQDGMFLRASGMESTWDGVVVRNNLFHSDADSAGGTASVYVSEGPSVDIINNVFLDDCHSNANINIGWANQTGAAQVVRIFNNTVIGNTRPLKVGSDGSSTDANPDVLDIRNNLLFRQLATNNECFLFGALDRVGQLTVDHNVYASWNDPIENTTAVHYNGYLTFAEWQALGYDEHGAVMAPALVSLEGLPSTWDAHLTGPGHPLVGMGADLSEYFTTDRDGKPRSGAFSVGAYEWAPEGSGGAGGAGGAGATGGSGGDTGGGTPGDADLTGDADSGCGCRATGRTGGAGWLSVGLLVLAAGLRRSRAVVLG